MKIKVQALLELGKQMRTAQKEYFAAPRDTQAKRNWLHQSKLLEKKFDKLVVDIDSGQAEIQF